MTPPPTSRHLGLDLGGTNVKWAVVAHDGSDWSTIARDQVATRLDADDARVPAGVVAQLSELAVDTAAAWGPLASVGIGVLLGCLGAAFTTRTLQSMLFGVSPDDPWSFTFVIAAVAAVSLAAHVVPALRAIHVDPVIALRTE